MFFYTEYCALHFMSALFGFKFVYLERARMKDASRARYGVCFASVGYVNKFCSVWSFLVRNTAPAICFCFQIIESAICQDCFVGYSYPGGFCPESCPLSFACSALKLHRSLLH